ncbi:DUF2059 domain-containing protein [Pseudomonas sichuanensis]|uniref:DUF2059 domain-containing protein n=3 Tax=Pseudomonas TaxID=286 RepID=A0ABM7CXJ4_9PSED|nr:MULTISPECIES: DUF2059 domain-containing protein [Pseudomonas]AZL71160.1 DUF2059 domain-containing protein [Pseudomonas oryziphila]AZL76197.1 DUF2059 domain-containing protein [Pseudomonas oryziphila]MCE1116058.1 DUF2059 domain-containing protein [Pseudomonas sp. NMI795_08]MDH0731664.1 DUF2059 domain-containing protein [Pseudomonas sichuanensis]MDH1585005.1 DUF2059 domain-containing protein [Pseudomonas sichuanensis]
MRRLFSLLLLMICTMPVWADNLDQLYKAAGWPDQRAHFNDAVSAAQQRYRNSLPPAVYQALVNNSNQRFQAQAMDRRAQAQLRSTLKNPAPALAFFQSPLGRKVVAAELLATRKDQLAKNAKGLPKIQASDNRQLIIGHLAQALPAREAGAEVSLAIAGVAADSLSSMIPGLFGGGQTQSLLDGQRQRLMNQVGEDLDNTLLYVYRDLSDAELEQFSTFAESPDGQAYYKAAVSAVRAALAVGQNANDLN